MPTTKETGSHREDVADALRRTAQHRTMLAELLEVHLRALRELRDLLARAGDAPPPEAQAAGIDEEIRRASRAAGLLAAGAGLPKPSVPKVLLVDDDPTTRNLISHFLRKEDFIVLKAFGGDDALAQARGARPDLLILDAALPGMDPFELLGRLRQETETRRLPVLMLSSLDDEEAIVKSLDAGTEYVVKPFSPRVLVAMIKKILKDL